MKITFNIQSIVAFIGLIIIVLGITSLATLRASADASGPMTGWLWSGGASGSTAEVSGGIGWISLNCSNTSTCGTVSYGLSAAVDGTISGYAWSENIGWVSANSADLAGCPTAPCTAVLQNGALTGWLKVLSGGTAESGGWSGWISLSGASPSYGPTHVNGIFSGYAWGSDIVGWIDFSEARGSCTPVTTYTCSGTGTIVRTDTSAQCAVTTTNTTCTAPSFCSTGSAICLYPPVTFILGGGKTGHLTASPLIVRKVSSTVLFWNIDNVASCTVTGTNGQNFSAGCSGNTCSSGASGVSTLPLNERTTFTLACTGVDGSAVNESVVVNIVPSFQER